MTMFRDQGLIYFKMSFFQSTQRLRVSNCVLYGTGSYGMDAICKIHVTLWKMVFWGILLIAGKRYITTTHHFILLDKQRPKCVDGVTVVYYAVAT